MHGLLVRQFMHRSHGGLCVWIQHLVSFLCIRFWWNMSDWKLISGAVGVLHFTQNGSVTMMHGCLLCLWLEQRHCSVFRLDFVIKCSFSWKSYTFFVFDSDSMVSLFVRNWGWILSVDAQRSTIWLGWILSVDEQRLAIFNIYTYIHARTHAHTP